MVLYDFLAPAYDPVFESIYLSFRMRALEMLPGMHGATVLDLACGTGQNFPLLTERVGAEGRIIGVDISSGMLRQARLRVSARGWRNVTLRQRDAAQVGQPPLPSVDFVVCTYGFTSMPRWKKAFRASWDLLKPGGGYLIHDIDAARRNLHVFVVELATRSKFSQKVWQPLREAGVDFRMDYLDPSAHLFGGRLFAAYGEKPPAPMRSSPWPS